MALPPLPGFPSQWKDRGTFYYDKATSSQVNKPVTDTRLDCKPNSLDTACVGNDYTKKVVAGDLKELDDCSPLSQVAFSVSITTPTLTPLSSADFDLLMTTYVKPMLGITN